VSIFAARKKYVALSIPSRRLLLSCGADVTAQNAACDSPLHMAARLLLRSLDYLDLFLDVLLAGGGVCATG
jgi:hypothetical protein